MNVTGKVHALVEVKELREQVCRVYVSLTRKEALALIALAGAVGGPQAGGLPRHNITAVTDGLAGALGLPGPSWKAAEGELGLTVKGTITFREPDDDTFDEELPF